MTDDLMDARLRKAGERWRASEPMGSERPDGTEELLELGRPHPPRRNRWLALASAAVVAAALIIGGALYTRGNSHSTTAGTNSAAADRLRGVRWTFGGNVDDLVFMNGVVRMYDGCSAGLYKLSISGDRFTIGNAIDPQNVCSGVPGSARPFDELLRGPVIWSVDGRTLTLTAANGATLTLTTDGRPAPAAIGTDWVLERVSMPADELEGSFGSARLRISKDGSFQANDLCNELSGKAKADTLSITFQHVESTERGCIDPGFTPATKVIDALLNGRVDYSIRGTELILGGKAGLLVYRAAGPSDANRRDPGQLVGPNWTLTGTETTSTSGNTSSGSGASAVGMSVLRFDGGGGFTIAHRCYTNQGKASIRAGTAVLSDVTPKTALPCPSNADSPGEQEENDFVDALLKGSVTWSVDDSQLTIAKGGKQATFASR